jgi:hypothetical protein
MALRGFWGFDGGSTTMAYPEWNGYNSTTGRDGVANHASSLLSNSTCSLTVPGAPMSSLIVGYALGRGVWTATSNRPIARFMNGTTTLGTLYFSGVSTNEIGFHNTVSEVAVTSGLNWLQNVDHYLEIAYTPHLTAGLCQVRVDGVQWMNFTARTAVSTTPVTGIDLINGAGSNGWIDDMYLLDLSDGTATDGRPNNTFLGDVKVAHGYPTGAGTTTGWTPSVAPNWGTVDENPPTTTDYVGALGGSNLIDTYVFPDLPGAAQVVYGVRLGMYAAKTDTGAASLQAVIRDNSVNSTISGTLGVGTTYGAYWSDFVKLRPNAGGNFSVANVNAMEIGVKAV